MDQIKQNRATVCLVLFCSYICSMVFFALVRIFGALWFQAEYIPSDIPAWTEYAVMAACLIFECTVMLKILTRLSWGRAALIAIAYKSACYLLASPVVFFIADILVIVLVPLALNRDKEKSLGRSILYALGIFVYQCFMMVGRGYSTAAKFDPVWQVVGTLDYRFFLLSILLLKGVLPMFGPGAGCMLLFGKFDGLARRIGHALLSPFHLGE